MYINIVYLALC